MKFHGWNLKFYASQVSQTKFFFKVEIYEPYQRDRSHIKHQLNACNTDGDVTLERENELF